MVTSAQLRAGRAYLGWTMVQAAKAAGLHQRTIIRLENDESYARRQPASLRRLVAIYREHQIILKGRGLALSGIATEPSLPSCPKIA